MPPGTLTEGMVWMTCRICWPPIMPVPDARMEPVDKTVAMVVAVAPVKLPWVIRLDERMVDVGCLASEGRGLLRERSTGSVWGLSWSSWWLLLLSW